MDGYDLDPETKELLTIDNLRGKFTSKEFLERLCHNNIEATKQNHGVFDPVPYIQTFEAALDRLKFIKEDVTSREDDLRRDMQQTERVHAQKTRQLNTNFENVISSFQGLESRISEVGTTAIRIGEQLEQLDKQQKRAIEARLLIECYTEFSRPEGTSPQLENLMNSGNPADVLRVAVITRRLTSVSKDIDLPNAAKTRAAIEAYIEQFERRILKHFDRAYRENNLDEMADAAKVLTEFNGGASVVQAFVNQHEFFIMRERLEGGDVLGDDPIWQRLPDPDAENVKTEPSLLRLYEEVRMTVEQEIQTIRTVFPVPENVIQVFLQRVFAQSIQQRLEELMDFAERNSTLAYLRCLQSSRTATISLVDDIKEFDTSSASLSVVDHSASAVSLVLDQNLEDLFVPYLEGNRYIEREKKSLEELFASFLWKFNQWHTARKQTKNPTMFDRVVNQISSAASSVRQTEMEPPERSATPSGDGRGASLRRLAGTLQRSHSSSKSLHQRDSSVDGAHQGLGMEPTEADGLLSIDAAKRMIKWHAESIGRTVELSSSLETAKDARTLLSVLMEYVGKAYVETALDAALSEANAQDTRSEPRLQYLQTIRIATSILQLLRSYIDTALIPLAASSLTLRREMANYTNNNIALLENKINNLVQKTIDIILAWVNALLARQKKTDFRPKEDEASISTLQTAPCLAVVDFLFKVHKQATKAFDGENLHQFLLQTGLSFQAALLDHFKKFQVTATGGISLTKDLTLYEEAVGAWRVQELRDGNEFLHELGNIFIVRPEILRSLLREGTLARIKPHLLLPYLQCRADFKTANIDRMVTGVAEKKDEGMGFRKGMERMSAYAYY
ncbi:Exocyst complex component 5 [Saitoella coloradoensis]